MNNLILILFLLIQSSVFSTEQIPDLLIVGKDTILLASFPLDNLGFKNFPFGLSPPHTGRWRGYQAIWIVENDSLFLQELLPCGTDSISSDFNSVDFFWGNGYAPKVINGKIFADWFTDKFIEYYRMEPYIFYSSPQEESSYDFSKDVVLYFKNGELILNRIK